MFNTTSSAPAMSLDQVVQAAKSAMQSRKALVAFLKEIAAEHGIKSKEIFDISQGSTMPVKYYDPASGMGWVGNETGPSPAFREAQDYDKANPNASQKRKEQFRIADNQAKEIALKLKRDVRTISNAVIKYAELVAETTNQPSVHMAA